MEKVYRLTSLNLRWDSKLFKTFQHKKVHGNVIIECDDNFEESHRDEANKNITFYGCVSFTNLRWLRKGMFAGCKFLGGVQFGSYAKEIEPGFGSDFIVGGLLSAGSISIIYQDCFTNILEGTSVIFEEVYEIKSNNFLSKIKKANDIIIPSLIYMPENFLKKLKKVSRLNLGILDYPSGFLKNIIVDDLIKLDQLTEVVEPLLENAIGIKSISMRDCKMVKYKKFLSKLTGLVTFNMPSLEAAPKNFAHRCDIYNSTFSGRQAAGVLFLNNRTLLGGVTFNNCSFSFKMLVNTTVLGNVTVKAKSINKRVEEKFKKTAMFSETTCQDVQAVSCRTLRYRDVDFEYKQLRNNYKYKDYIWADGEACLVLTTRDVLGLTLLKCRPVRQNWWSEFYIVFSGEISAHGYTAAGAVGDLKYKIKKDAELSLFRSYKLDTKLTIEEGITMYRSITGACDFGVRSFLEDKGIDVNSKKKYTLAQIVEMTKNKYGHLKLLEFYRI